MKKPSSRRYIAVALLGAVALLLAIRLADMTVLRPGDYTARIRAAWSEAEA